jgi:hypothetical protein
VSRVLLEPRRDLPFGHEPRAAWTAQSSTWRGAGGADGDDVGRSVVDTARRIDRSRPPKAGRSVDARSAAPGGYAIPQSLEIAVKRVALRCDLERARQETDRLRALLRVALAARA